MKTREKVPVTKVIHLFTFEQIPYSLEIVEFAQSVSSENDIFIHEAEIITKYQHIINFANIYKIGQKFFIGLFQENHVYVNLNNQIEVYKMANRK